MTESVVKHPCQRCGHSGDWHSLRDEQNVSPVDPAALFPCNGINLAGCADACPDFEGEAITIVRSETKPARSS